MPYVTGLATLVHGTASVVIDGAGLETAGIKGGLFSCRGYSVPMLEPTSETEFDLAYPWPGPDLEDVQYAIEPALNAALTVVWANTNFQRLLAKLSLIGIIPDGSGTIAERNALDPVPSPGYMWFHFEENERPALYKKSESGWDGPVYFDGEAGSDGNDGTDGVQSSNGSVTDIVKLTLSEYEELSPPDAQTIYWIEAD